MKGDGGVCLGAHGVEGVCTLLLGVHTPQLQGGVVPEVEKHLAKTYVYTRQQLAIPLTIIKPVIILIVYVASSNISFGRCDINVQV